MKRYSTPAYRGADPTLRRATERGHASTSSSTGDGLPGLLAAPRASALDGAPEPVPYKDELEAFFGTDLGGLYVWTGQGEQLDPLGAHGAYLGDTIAFADPVPPPEVVVHEVSHWLVGDRQPLRDVQGVSTGNEAAEGEAGRAVSAFRSQRASLRARLPGDDAVDTAGEALGYARELTAGLAPRRLHRCAGPVRTDELGAPPEADAHFATIETAMAHKRQIRDGTRPLSELDAVEERLRGALEALRGLGVMVDEEQLVGTVEAGRGADLFELTGSVVQDPSGPGIIGERRTFRANLDYVPPGRTIRYGWRWRSGDDRRLMFLLGNGLPALGPQSSITLDDLFWAGTYPRIERNGGLVVLVEVYVGDADVPATTLETPFIPMQRQVPTRLAIQYEPAAPVPGSRVTLRIADWAPTVGAFRVRWSVDGEPVGDPWVLTHTFTESGARRVRAELYERGGWLASDDRLAETTVTVPVRTAVERGTEVLESYDDTRLPSLAAIDRSLDGSIASLEDRVALDDDHRPHYEERLEAQRQRKERLNALTPDLATLREQPGSAAAMEVGHSYDQPVNAVLVVHETGEVQPLSINLVTTRETHERYVARLIDSTGADVLKFDGSGATALAAWDAVFRDWRGNPYPRGCTLVHEFSPPGWSGGQSFETTTAWKIAKAWIDSVLLVGGLVVGGLLLLAPDATVTKVLGVALIAASLGRGSVAIAENLDQGIAPLDSRNILEGVAIVASVTGVTGSVLRQVGARAIRPFVFRAGNWVIVTSLAMDVGTVVYATAEAIARISAIQSDPTLDDAQRSTELMRVISTLLAQGAMLVVSNRDLFQGGLSGSDFFRSRVPASADVELGTGARLDVELELRRMGVEADDLRSMSNRALLDRYFVEVGSASGTRGAGAYRMGPRGGVSDAGVQAELAANATGALGVDYAHGARVSTSGTSTRTRRIGGHDTTETFVQATLTVRNAAGDTVDVPVTIVTVPDARGLFQGAHRGDSGPVRMRIQIVEDGGTPRYRAEVRIDSRVHPSEVPGALAHELDELARVVHAGRTGAALEAQTRAGLLRPGGGGTPTDHDFAIAAELRRAHQHLAELSGDDLDAARAAMAQKLAAWGLDDPNGSEARLAFHREQGVPQDVLDGLQRRLHPPGVGPGWGDPWTPPRNWNGPRNHGRWTGVRGNSAWIDTRPEVIRVVGTNPTTGEANPILFYMGRADFSPYVQEVLTVPGLVGTSVDVNHDFRLIYQRLMEVKGLESQAAARRWLNSQPDGYGGTGLAPHHAGGDRIELLPRALHNVQHTDMSLPGR